MNSNFSQFGRLRKQSVVCEVNWLRSLIADLNMNTL